MSIYSLCSSALSRSLSPTEVYTAQSVSCALLAASALLLSAASLFLFTRVPGGEASGAGWARKFFDAFIYQFVARSGIVSLNLAVNQFRRVFLALVAAAGFLQGAASVMFLMVHRQRLLYNRSNTTDSPGDDLEVAACGSGERSASHAPPPVLQVLASLEAWAAAYYALQPLGSWFSRWLQAPCAALIPAPHPLLSLSRLLFLSHLARFIIRVRCVARDVCQTRHLLMRAPLSAARAPRHVHRRQQGCVPPACRALRRSSPRRVGRHCFLQRSVLHVSQPHSHSHSHRPRPRARNVELPAAV
jgi:hypothetical protein